MNGKLPFCSAIGRANSMRSVTSVALARVLNAGTGVMLPSDDCAAARPTPISRARLPSCCFSWLLMVQRCGLRYPKVLLQPPFVEKSVFPFVMIFVSLNYSDYMHIQVRI